MLREQELEGVRVPVKTGRGHVHRPHASLTEGAKIPVAPGLVVARKAERRSWRPGIWTRWGGAKASRRLLWRGAMG